MAARIPSYQRRVGPEVVGAPRALAASTDATGLARGVSNLAGDLAEIEQREIQEANQTALLNADNQLGSWQNNALFNPEGGAFTKKGSGALNITQSVLADFDKQQQAISDTLTTPQQRQMFQQSSLQRRTGLESKLGSYEFGEQQAYKDDVDKSSIELAMNSAALNYNDPQSVEQSRAKMDAVLQLRGARNGWSPEEMEAQRQNANSSMSQAVIQRMLVDSPQNAKALYEQYKGGMTAEDQIRATSSIDQGMRRLQAEARARQAEARQMQAIARVELQSRVQDAESAYMQGFEYDNPPNKADFIQALGPERADEAYKSFEKRQSLAPAIRDFATATPEERQEILAKFQPAKDGVAGQGFSEDDQLYQRLTTVTTGLLKQQQEDPAGYVARYSPTVRASFEAAQQTGTTEAYEAYAAATVAEQQRLGVQSPKLLPDAAANQIAAGFNSQVLGGESAATLIEQQQEQWGKNFPLIAQQLGNKLPPEAQVIATSLPKDLAERMASVAPLSEADLKKGLDKGIASNVEAAVQASMAPFAASLQGQTGGINTFNTMYQAANKAALSYVRQGMTPEKAAERVANGMVNDKYDFFGTYRVPKTLDTQAVSRGADRSLASIKADDLMLLPGLRGVTDETNLEQLREAVVGGGQWVPTNDESGLALTLNGYRVLGKDGNPIVRSWDELTADGLRQEESSASKIGRVRGLGITN
ncbi:hypothetical protein [Pseudomonas sp. Hg5Tf]|uniref:Uncharacterized protein n=1 Tax=Pseudomonas sp. Hg7Tf TaxID=3236988 RepID=A0AB39HVF5_9PSED|nr:hypothetical protein [Pseudomonas sp. Hg5Tf]MDH2558996.1 hypothetical protein [Pseudomonas sp. Hg5Tf]